MEKTNVDKKDIEIYPINHLDHALYLLEEYKKENTRTSLEGFESFLEHEKQQSFLASD